MNQMSEILIALLNFNSNPERGIAYAIGGIRPDSDSYFDGITTYVTVFNETKCFSTTRYDNSSKYESELNSLWVSMFFNRRFLTKGDFVYPTQESTWTKGIVTAVDGDIITVFTDPGYATFKRNEIELIVGSKKYGVNSDEFLQNLIPK